MGYAHPMHYVWGKFTIMVKIEKGIEIPKKNTGSGRKYKFPWNKMEVGDSFFVKGDAKIQGRTCFQSAYRYKKRNSPEFGVSVRKVDGGIRVWRIK